MKGVFIYLIFIVSLAILSEWLINYRKKNEMYRTVELPGYSDNKLDLFLDGIKSEIKREYMNKFNSYSNNMSRESFIPTQYFPPSSEQALLAETAKKIQDMGGALSWNTHSDNQRTLGQDYLRLQNYTEEYNTPSDFIHRPSFTDYRNLKSEYIAQNKPMVFPKKDAYKIDGYKYSQNNGTQYSQNTYTPKKFNVNGVDMTLDNEYSQFQKGNVKKY
jgi:hypothetical protein